MKFLAKIGGRKFIVTLFTLIAVALSASLGISETVVLTIGGIVSTYLFGQSAADAVSKGATSSNPPPKE